MMHLQQRQFRRLFNALVMVFAYCVLASGTLIGQNTKPADDLAQSATWAAPTLADVKSEFEDWLHLADAKPETRQRVREFLDKDFKLSTSGDLVDWVLDGIVIARPDVNELREQLQTQRNGSRAPDFSRLLDNKDEEKFLQNHVRLFYARWLTQNEFYDEALGQFSKLEFEKSLDPASLLFYRGLVEHQLLKKNDCVVSIRQLLENADQLPRRYVVLGKLMLADIENVETDSLDEISRMMNDIRRRTGLYRSGKTVLTEEEAVIKKLDKLIEGLEAQRQQQQTGSTVQPSTPMNDSMKSGGKGSGEVTSKRQPEGGDWGDLPPADRAAALAEMAKDMPPHYRAVIEEYFKQLAKESDR